ncbi:protein HIR [Favolaschia claudopus]|uniref:Protein HIR n=1 Tax=Favolaschia claudopus TaxID=2862362 RepID=A0AAW0D6G8_9AGAR
MSPIMTAFSVYCAVCGLYFDDVVARSEHIEHSLKHPRFINFLESSSSTSHSVPEGEDGGDILECDEVILTWMNDFATSFDAAEIEQGSEEDFWSSEIDTDSNGSTESDKCEEGSTYHELLFKNLVDTSEIPESCHCLSVAESKPTQLYIDERIGL